MSLRILILVLCCFIISPVYAASDFADLKQKALAGDAWSQLNLGAAYDNGLLNLGKSPEQAVIWYRRAAMQGVAEAEFNLAHCLATGHGTDQNNVEARIWMNKAAKQQLPDAQFLLGIMYIEGIGGNTDLAKGKYWLTRAAGHGQKDAKVYLNNF